MYGVSWWSIFIFLHVAVQISQHHLLKRLFLLMLYFCPLCWILIDRRDLDLFLGPLFCSIDLCVSPYTSTRLFWLQWTCNIVWYQILWSLLWSILSAFKIAINKYKIWLNWCSLNLCAEKSWNVLNVQVILAQNLSSEIDNRLFSTSPENSAQLRGNTFRTISNFLHYSIIYPSP